MDLEGQTAAGPGLLKFTLHYVFASVIMFLVMLCIEEFGWKKVLFKIAMWGLTCGIFGFKGVLIVFTLRDFEDWIFYG